MGSRSSETEEPVNSCAHCRKDATLVCNGCHHAPNYHGVKVESVWYCSPNCQVQDRSQHKSACKAAQDRRALYRAGATAQLAFYRYVEKFAHPFQAYTRVEKKGDGLYVYEAEASKHSDDVRPFIWKDCDSEEDKLTVLTLMMCGNSTGFVHVLVDIMLPG